MAPQLQHLVYGEVGRIGGAVAWFGPLQYRASVFLQSGLELTPLMGAAALCGFWLWRGGGLKKIGIWPTSGLAAAALVSCIMGKSLGGFTLTVAGAAILLAIQRTRWTLLLAIVLCTAPLYITVRSTGLWSGRSLTSFLAENVSERRSESLTTRLDNEDRLIDHTMARPVFGWGGWSRSHVRDDSGRDITITDGMWIIAFGQNGWIGLASLYAALLLPVVLVIKRGGVWLVQSDPAPAAVLVLSVLLVLHSVDFLFNAMPNPIWAMVMGALAGCTLGIANTAHRTTARGMNRRSRLITASDGVSLPNRESRAPTCDISLLKA